MGENLATKSWKLRVVMPTLWVIDPVGVSTLSTFGALRWAFPSGGAYGSEPLRGSTLNGEAVLREPAGFL